MAGSLHVATLPRILNGSLAGSLEVATPLKNPSKGFRGGGSTIGPGSLADPSAGSLEVATPLKNPSKGSVEEVLLLAHGILEIQGSFGYGTRKSNPVPHYKETLFSKIFACGGLIFPLKLEISVAMFFRLRSS